MQTLGNTILQLNGEESCLLPSILSTVNKIEVADVSAYKQFGNSVAIPAIQATAKNLIQKIIGE